MTIAVFAGYFFPHKGGYEAYVLELGRRLVHRGHNVIVVTVAQEGERFHDHIGGVTIFRLPGWHVLKGTYPVPKLSGQLFKLPQALREKGVELVNTHTRFFLTSLFGAIVAKMLHLPLIHTEHGSGPVSHASVVKLIAWAYDQSLGRLTVSLADTVIALSKRGERFVKSLGAKRSVVIPNGIDTEFFHPRFLKKPEPLVVFVGRLIHMKGVQDLLAVWPEVGKGKKLIVIGDGPYRADLERKAKTLSEVEFAGEKDREGVRDILSKAALLVNPSYAEGVPTSVLEAVSMGLPVVASDVGGTAEIARTNKRVFLYPAGDLKVLAKNIMGALNVGCQNPAPVFLKRFDWNSIVDQCEKAFQEYAKT